MYVDTSCSKAAPPATPKLQRAEGRIRISFRRRGGATCLDRLYQEGSAKIRLPRRIGGAATEAVVINTAGGLTGGDALSTCVVLQRGAQAVVTTQACERIYRSADGPAKVAAHLEVGEGARLDWLPQETILFDGGRLSRVLHADLAQDAGLLIVEALILGREAMGESVRSGSFRDRWRIRRDGRLIFADDLRIEGEMAGLLARPAVLGGQRAMATVLLAAADCERWLEPARDAIGDSGGASAWDGKLLIRIAAPDGFALRQALMPVLSILMAGRPLPKVWQI